ncbi:MAG: preprotein translocase subunit SecA [Gammaproteobacteria bacterium]|nr:preprotein translocase subunit SecA [Gammaproteobacteria bacterium]
MKNFLKKIFGSRNERVLKKYAAVLNQVNSYEEKISLLQDEQFKNETNKLKERVSSGESLEEIMSYAYALVREASKRTLNMRHFDEQILGGIALHYGNIAEMKTGEGKTLVATLPVYLNCLSGKSVHIVTVNDYLAKRDSEWMGNIYSFLGLSTGVIISGQDNDEKIRAYKSDVIYGTNNEFGFDYLRDNMVSKKEQKTQKDLTFAIVDEVDSILIDEARTPLIISGATDESSKLYSQFNQLTKLFKEGLEEDKDSDFYLDEKSKQVYLTEKGHDTLENVLIQRGIIKSDESLYDPNNIKLLHFMTTALRAHYLFQKNVDYIIEDSKIVIIDEFTGRKMPGRRWGDGLHQAIEAKESLKIESENRTYASITFQNYFRLYDKISGMTGTADTEAEEFQEIYSLEVISIPTNKDMVRDDLGDLVYLSLKEKYEAIVNDIKESIQNNRPVLVGTASIESSEYLSKVLNKEKIAHEILNAKFHEKESMIIENAGEPSAVTIATNMAGRGTDIALGGKPKDDDVWKKKNKLVCESGGLHVIGTERHESRRIDNQLRGRSGRQGDPGSSRFYLSLEDNLMRIFASEKVSQIMQKLGMEQGEAIEHPWVTKSISNAQKKVETHNFDIRKHLLEYDDVMNEQRKFIYQKRNQIIDEEYTEDIALQILEETFLGLLEIYINNENQDIQKLEEILNRDFGLNQDFASISNSSKNKEEIYSKFLEFIFNHYRDRKLNTPSEVYQELEESLLLNIIDTNWVDHIQNMDSLRQGIMLRSYAQKNPKQEYKREGYNMFTEMINNAHYSFSSILLRLDLSISSTYENSREPKDIKYIHNNPSTTTSENNDNPRHSKDSPPRKGFRKHSSKKKGRGKRKKRR